MKLLEVFDQLKHGELSQISIGEIKEDDYPKLLSHVNLGLAALYKRFAIKEGRIGLLLQPSQYTYLLTSKYALNNSRSRITELSQRYVRDTGAEPFKDDILKIEEVWSVYGHEFSLNDRSDPLSMRTPKSNTLLVPELIVAQSRDLPEQLRTSELELVYRASHPKISVDDASFDVETTELELPDSHLEALLYFIAARIFSPIGMGQAEGASSNVYLAKYEAACQQLEMQNLRVDQDGQNTRLERGGWV